MEDRGGTISPAVLLRFLRLLMCSVDIHEHPSKLFVKSMPREPFHPVSWYPTGGMKIKSAAWWRVQAIGLVLGLVKFLKSRVPSAHLSHLFFQVKCFPIWSIKDCCKSLPFFPAPLSLAFPSACVGLALQQLLTFSLFQVFGKWSGARSKRKRWKGGRGKEEGTTVRFVFKKSFRPLCRLVIRP